MKLSRQELLKIIKNNKSIAFHTPKKESCITLIKFIRENQIIDVLVEDDEFYYYKNGGGVLLFEKKIPYLRVGEVEYVRKKGIEIIEFDGFIDEENILPHTIHFNENTLTTTLLFGKAPFTKTQVVARKEDFENFEIGILLAFAKHYDNKNFANLVNLVWEAKKGGEVDFGVGVLYGNVVKIFNDLGFSIKQLRKILENTQKESIRIYEHEIKFITKKYKKENKK